MKQIKIDPKTYCLSNLQLENFVAEYYGTVQADTATNDEVMIDFESVDDAEACVEMLNLTFKASPPPEGKPKRGKKA